MKVGDVVKIEWEGHPKHGDIGMIVERTIDKLPPGTDRILVYKLLIDGIILKVPHKWMTKINTHPETQEK